MPQTMIFFYLNKKAKINGAIDFASGFISVMALQQTALLRQNIGRSQVSRSSITKNEQILRNGANLGNYNCSVQH